MASDYQLIILAAGKGVRMQSHLPKVLHRVCGLSILERVLRAGLALNPKRIVVVVGYGEAAMREELELLRTRSPELSSGKTELKIAVQREQRGTGDAVRSGLIETDPKISRVMILPGDIPLITKEALAEIAAGDQKLGSPDLLVVSCEPPSPFGYGRIIRDANGKFTAIIEQKDCNEAQAAVREINSSLYCGDLAFIESAAQNFKPNNAQGELYFTDAASFGVAQGKKIEALKLRDAMVVAGANSRAELSELERFRRETINREWMERGVTLEDPRATYIDEDVTLKNDVFIGAGTHLRGKCSIESGVQIDGNSFIANTAIDSNTHVKFSCVMDSAKVGADCKIGPFAHLRPGSVLNKSVHIGNFVESKQSEFGEGSKANHLTYIGDASVGAQTNIGAGTITCNYDGVKKSRTTIGANAFIGSNTALIAPVTVGDGAYVGAGSVIHKDVPGGALGIARAEQKILPGYAERKKKS